MKERTRPIFALRIDPKLNRLVRIEAAKRGMRLGKFVEIALRAELKQKGGK